VQNAGLSLFQEYLQSETIILTLSYFSPENALIETKVKHYRIVQAGRYWDALVEPVEDPDEKRKDAIWQAVRDIANNSGGGEGP